MRREKDKIFIVPIGSDCGFVNGVCFGHVDVLTVKEEVKNGDLGVFKLNGEYVFKRFQKHNELIILTEPNKEPITISKEDKFSVLGKAKSYYVSI